MLYIQKCWPSSFKLFTPVFKQLNLHSGCQSPKKPVISKTQWCRNPFSGWLIWFCINRRLKRDLKKYAFVQASTSYFLFLPPINLTLQGWWIKKWICNVKWSYHLKNPSCLACGRATVIQINQHPWNVRNENSTQGYFLYSPLTWFGKRLIY